MAGSTKDSGAKVKKKLWEETPNTFTEFGALSSDMKPSGNFFSRFWKRNKDDGNQSTAPPITNLHDDTLLGRSNNSLYNEAALPSNNMIQGVMPPPIGRLSRQSSRSSTLVDDDAMSTVSAPAATGGRLDQSEDVFDCQDSENRVQPRTLTSVLTRLGSILDQRSSTPQTYKDSDFKQYWMPDSSCKECYDCGDKFTTFRRRHHCRICGQIFCSKCCNQELSGKIIGYKGGIRVCTYCCRVVQRYAQQSASTGDAKALEDLRAISQLYHDSGSFEFGHRSQSPRLSMGDLSPQMRGDSLPDLAGMVASDMNTPFDLTPQSEFSSQESLMLESKLLIQDSVQLRELWRQICDSELGVETQTLRIRLRVHQNCIVGKELVDWLIKRDKAATRDQAIAIGQAFLYAGYLECVGSQLPVFKDDFTLYRHGEMATSMDLLGEPETVPTMKEDLDKNEPLWFQEIGKIDDVVVDSLTSTDEQHSNTPEAETQKLNSSESDTRTLFYNDVTHSGSFSEMPKAVNLMSRDMVEEPLPRQDSSVHGLGDDFLKGALFLGKPPMPSSDVVTCPHGWRVVDQLREENGEKLAYERLKKAHTELWDSMTRQLLSQNSLFLSWESVISTCITQVSHFVRPDVRLEGDDMDIRNYVHIKKVPGGHKSDTSMFHGVIFSKNVAHKKMKTKIINPLILLLRGTIEFQRIENKFSSLEPQILQEREFMRNCVMKMIAYRPNVVVVEKSVSRLAQEYLLEAGITLLFNVKLSVMERLARFTQADIVPSIDGLVSRPKMGFCHDFRVQTYNLPTGDSKTLAIFDGCATHLGCTIVLSGGTLSELRRVKKILKFMTYTAYNSLLELCFCMDEFALPQPGADEIGQPFEGLENSVDYNKDSQINLGSIRPEEMAFEKNSQDSDTNTYDNVEFHIETDSELEMELVGLEMARKNSGNLNKEKDSGAVCKYSNLQGQAQTSGRSQPSDSVPDEKQDVYRGRSCSLNSSNTDKNNQSSEKLLSGEIKKSYDKNDEENREEPMEKRARHGSEPVRGKGHIEDVKKTQNKTDSSGKANTEVENAFNSNALLSVACEHHFGTADNSSETTTKPTNATVPVVERSTPPVMDYLSAVTPAFGSASHREKIRHSSGMSTSDDISGRSTPDCVFKNNSSEETAWDGTPRVIGNIVCIIPKSALPVSAIAPTQSDAINAIEKQKSKSSSDVPPSHDFTAKSCEERSYTNTPPSKDQKLLARNSSEDSFKRHGSITPSSKSSREDSQPSSLASSVGGLKKQERSFSEGLTNRPSTSKLTELTDFSDPLLGYQNTQDESIFSSTSTQKIALKEIKQSKYKRFRKALDGVQLSISPYHKYSIPFIETDKGSRCAVRKYLPDEIFWSSLFDGEGDQRPVKSKLGDELPNKYSNRNHIQIMESHPLITCKLTEPIWEPQTQTILADFRARGGRIHVMPNNFGRHPPPIEHVYKKGEDNSVMDPPFVGPMWEKKIDCLSPINHQKLMVLFSSYSYKSVNHPYPCVYPWVVTMEFYARNDITLGAFLERFCFRKQYTCPSPTCDTPMTDHVRRFVHGNACINVLLKKLDNDVPGGKDNILMWSWCRKCKQVTPVVPISGDTWSLSFAKYLDLRFHSSSFMRRASAEPCMHSLHHDHFQYFGHRNIVASFKFATISLKELALPASTVTVQPPVFDPVKLTEQVRGILYKATEKYSIMVENTMKLKHELTNEPQIKILSDILTEQQNDKKSFRDSATNIQMKIQELIHSVTVQASNGQSDCDLSVHLNSIFDNIELLKRHICEDVSKWNTRMQEFMAHHQKKSRAQTSNKKDRDSGTSNVEELEKSWKSVTDRNFSKVSVPPSPVLPPKVSHTQSVSPSQQATVTTPLSGVPSTAISTVPTSTPTSSASIQATEDQTKGLVGETNTTTTNTTQTQDTATTANSTTTPAIPKVHVTETSTSSVASTTGPTPSTVQATLILSPPVAAEVAGLEDSPDGWFHDLKGVTKRWLSASTFTPLPLPFEPNEHHNLPMCERVPIVVYDHEPSSIIAYALSSSDYLCRLREIQTSLRVNSNEPTSLGQTGKQTSKLTDPSHVSSQGNESNTETGRKGGMLSFLRGSSRDPSPLHTPHQGHTSVDTVRYVPGADWGDSVNIEDADMSALSDDATPSPDERPKVRSPATSPHIELQFSDSTAKFYCRVYFADQFRKLRKLICPGSDNIFIRSLSRCKPWEAKGGKSGSSFSKTDDDRFILKQMSNMEVESFEKFGPQYFQYIKACTMEQQPTALAKILGVYRIGFRNTQTNHALRQDVLVMENLFYNRRISQKFDLKGSMRNRMVNTTSKRAEEELVLLDENLLKCSVESPLYLRPHSKYVLKSAITSDSTFLSANLVMDYSLLVGVDEETKEMVVGIIDYIRTFTWDKKLEMVVKSSGILGGQGKMPTVVSPQLYRGRFLEAMDRYFLHVPDHWTGLGRDSPPHKTKVDTYEN